MPLKLKIASSKIEDFHNPNGKWFHYIEKETKWRQLERDINEVNGFILWLR